MTRLRSAFAILVVCGLAVGLVALSAGIGQAEVGAKWSLINKEGKLVEISKTLLPSVFIAEVVTNDMTLLFTTSGGTKVELLCEGATFIGARLETEGHVGGENKTKFGGCTTKLNGKVSANCKPRTPGSESGTLVSAALKGLLVLTASKETVVLFEPVSGTAFLTIEFGEECAIGNLCTITGKNSIKDVNGEWGVAKVSHLVEQGSISTLSVLGVPASVDGQGVLNLSGEHTGVKWSGVPA